MDASGRQNRRQWLQSAAWGAGCLGLAGAVPSVAWAQSPRTEQGAPAGTPNAELTKAKAGLAPTRFQIACSTLPYSRFPLIRALQGIAGAGFKYVVWGTTHDNGERVPILAETAELARAKELGQTCRDMKLVPLMLSSQVSPEQKDAVQILTHRIEQAQAAGIPQVLTFGQTRGGNRPLWIERLKQVGPIAKDHNVLVVIKPYGAEMGSGKACAEIVKEVDHSHVMLSYDAANVLDFLNTDPIADLKTCIPSVRSVSIKDHRKSPKPEDCGPGLGEIDHYKLLGVIAHTGQEIPLYCENVFAPLLPRPSKPEEVDVLARRAREFLELVIAGLQSMEST